VSIPIILVEKENGGGVRFEAKRIFVEQQAIGALAPSRPKPHVFVGDLLGHASVLAMFKVHFLFSREHRRLPLVEEIFLFDFMT